MKQRGTMVRILILQSLYKLSNDDAENIVASFTNDGVTVGASDKNSMSLGATSMTMLDGASTVLSIFASVLMVLRYSEQWFFWIVVDVITVALWCFAGDPIMIAMCSAYLVNAVYGYLMWLYKCGRNVPFEKLLQRAA